MIESTTIKNKNIKEKVRVIEDGNCNRCFSQNIGLDCHNRNYCLDCYTYGSISGDRYLYRYDRKVIFKNHSLNIDYELSEMQKKGSDFLSACHNKKKSGFLHAVCGAGKTEMTYQVILNSIKNNERVCFVIPRVQVLDQVYKRFLKHFPKTIIKKLCQDYKDYNDAHIIISTPQQLINFYKEFELIIVDENDAFPLRDNVFLQRLIFKARSDFGTILYMSATITKTFEEKIRTKELEYFLIPERYHYQDLPIPKFIKCNDYKKNIKLAKFLLEHEKSHRKLLIFVPSIEKAKKYHDYLSQKYECEYMTSKTENKKEILDNFEREDYYFLITTTLLERGVTFKGIDVIVFEADHDVFDKETLIQIAGRVGRNLSSSQGEIIFFSKYISNAMVDSKKELILMNKMKNDEM